MLAIGSAGFIGSNFVLDWLAVPDTGAEPVVTLDALTYAGNLKIVHTICRLLDEMQPDPAGPYARLVTHVKDRPGHDRRYAIDARKTERALGWRPAETFDTGIRKTVHWLLEHRD